MVAFSRPYLRRPGEVSSNERALKGVLFFGTIHCARGLGGVTPLEKFIHNLLQKVKVMLLCFLVA